MVRERRALATAILALYMFVFLLLWLIGPPAGWAPYLGATAAIYGAAFFGIAAGYFWARWYAIGLGIYGLVSAVMGVVQIGLEPIVLFMGCTHAAVSLALWGNRMAGLYDGQGAWRERFHLDEASTNRLGKAVIRIGFSLPIVIAYSLAPRPDAALGVVAVAALGLAGLGALGLLRMRTWGVLALGASALAMLSWAGVAAMGWAGSAEAAWAGTGAGAGLLLAWCAWPFAGPCARFVRA